MNTIMNINKNDFDLACLSQPKYKAVAEFIEQAILSGELSDQQKLPAQRWLADALEITHGTVTRAYDLLEKMNLVTAKLGAGTYVNLPIGQVKKVLLKEYDFASSMQPMLGQQNLVTSALKELSLDIEAVEQLMIYAPQGVQKHKQIFTDWLATKEVNIDCNDLVFTQGAQQGIYTCLQVLTKANDYVLHEAMAYPGFFRAVDACKVNPLAVPITSEGIDLIVLEDYCQQFQPKALYITPNMQNPTNVQYSTNTLSELIRLSRQYDFYLIEDDVNYCLPESWRVPLQQQASDRVFYLSSLSKYVAGGLRVAYALPPKHYQQAFNLSIHSQCWMVSTMNVEIAARFIAKENFQYNQTLLANEMRYRQKAFGDFATKYNLEFRSGGLNVWLILPSTMNMNQFSGFCASKNIKVRTADLFCHVSATQQIVNGLRVSLGGFNLRSDFDVGLKALENAFLNFHHQQDIII
jgi:DNA-binding transcriptional MocR family regulator